MKFFQFYVSSTGTGHNSICERAIQTYKHRLGRYFTENNTRKWIDVYHDIANAYNKTVHHSTDLAPIDINLKNSRKIHTKLYGNIQIPEHCRFAVNNVVRIKRKTNIFTKGYTARWSSNLYKIKSVHKSNVCFYYLISLDENFPSPKKSFVNEELNLVFAQ